MAVSDGFAMHIKSPNAETTNFIVILYVGLSYYVNLTCFMPTFDKMSKHDSIIKIKKN